MNIGLERGNLIVVPRPSRPTLSQEEKEREREGGREGEREGEKEGGRSSREEHSSDVQSLGVNAQQASSLGVVGDWAAVRALLVSAMLLRCLAAWP